MDGYEVELREQLGDVYRAARFICVTPMAELAARVLAQVAETAGFETPTTVEGRQASPLIGLAVHADQREPDIGFPILSLDRPSSGDLVADTLGSESAVAEIPPSILDELDAWDPDRTARVLVPPFFTGRPVAGRDVFGGRPPAWVALEDKLAVLEVWDRAGLATAPSEIVELDDVGAATAAHRRLAGPNGSVWAADNNSGLHGGAAGTHWVASTKDVAELAARLGTDHDRVRIMPFLNGVPCSMHGIVLDEGTVIGRPNEMMVFVDEATHRFHYCRFGNHWDPPAKDREAMAAAVKSVGDTLRAMVDFRGVFSLDGVLTADGFRPTEINPRYGVALPFNLPTTDGASLNLLLLDKAIIAGALQPDAEPLQRWLLRALDGNRQGGATFAAANRPDETRSATVVGDGADMRLVDDDDGSGEEPPTDQSGPPPLASITWMPLGAGQRLWITFGEAFPIGPPAAPLAWRIARLVDDHWGVGLDDLTPALSLGSPAAVEAT